MKKRNAFSDCHPAVNFLYFGLVLLFCMALMHPLCLFISLASALVSNISLSGRKGARSELLFLLPVMIIAALLNPAFNHAGVTVLAYLPSGNPLTLESVIYGLAAAAMLASVIIWFACYTKAVASDKFVYVFGRVIPALSLVLSMTLRFVPRFISQIKKVNEAQRCIGRDVSEGKLTVRLRRAVTVLSVMLTWSLENAIETADSMKSRGYGLPGRTSFSVYRFDDRDRAVLLWLIFCGMYLISGWAAGAFYFSFYPAIKCAPFSAFSVSFYAVYALLCLTPVIMNAREERKWKNLISGI